MRRRREILVIVAAVVLSLAGCSGNSGEPDAPVSVVTVTATAEVEPAEQPTGPASDASQGTDEIGLDTVSFQACMDIQEKLLVANAEMIEIMDAADSKEPQAVVDMYTELADAIGAIADSTVVPDLQEAARAAHADFVAIRDGMKQVYVDEDMSGLSELTEATLSMQKTYKAMLDVCVS